jgi:hypothetical protein
MMFWRSGLALGFLLILAFSLSGCQPIVAPETAELTQLEEPSGLLGTWQVMLADRSDYYFRFDENGQVIGCNCPNAMDWQSGANAHYRFADGALFIEEGMHEDTPFTAAGIHSSKPGEEVPYAVFIESDTAGEPANLVLEPMVEEFSNDLVVMRYVNR